MNFIEVKRQIERIKTFKRWRAIVKSNPKKYRIRKHSGLIGLAFSLQEWSYSRGHDADLFILDNSMTTSYRTQRIGGEEWGWTIIEYSGLWGAFDICRYDLFKCGADYIESKIGKLASK